MSGILVYIIVASSSIIFSSVGISAQAWRMPFVNQATAILAALLGALRVLVQHPAIVQPRNEILGLAGILEEVL